MYGTFTPPTDENKNDTDYQSVYKTFTNQFIICRIVATLNWQLAKNMVKAFSQAYDKGIISENFIFYSDDIYSKLTKFERTVNSDGSVICCGMPPYVTITWSVNNMDIHVQIVNDALTNLTTDIDAYCQTCRQFGKNPAIELRVRKTNGIDLSYDVFLYYTGNDFAGTTFINGSLTYCRLTMKDMSDTLGKKHFSYTIEDQSNVKDLIIAAIFTDFTLPLPYHADGEPCTLYQPNDIQNIYMLLSSNKTYHTTYCNVLNAMINLFSID